MANTPTPIPDEIKQKFEAVLGKIKADQNPDFEEVLTKLDEGDSLSDRELDFFIETARKMADEYAQDKSHIVFGLAAQTLTHKANMASSWRTARQRVDEASGLK